MLEHRSCIEYPHACRYWDFGILPVIQDMFKDPAFRAGYKQPRAYDDRTSYFACEAFKEYDAAANGKAGMHRPPNSPPTCMFQLGGDGVSLLNFGQRSATVIGVRCEEMPGDVSQTRLSWRPVIIIEGPRETTNLQYIMEDTVKQLCMHAPMANAGTTVFPDVVILAPSACTLCEWFLLLPMSTLLAVELSSGFPI